MGFLNPTNLLWSIALAVLAIIYLRSRSRPTISVSSLMLFEEMPAPVASVRHVRIDPLFWLEVAALAALILAIGGLYTMVPAHAGRGRSHALVFDVGAGMSAQSGGTSSLDKAGKQALEIVDAAPAGDEFSVITYALEAQVALPQTQDLAEVRKAIRGLHPYAVASHASALSAAIMRARGSSQIELFTDRRPAPEALQAARAATPVQINLSAHGDDNVAIVALDPGVVDSSHGRVMLRNFSLKPRLAELQVRAANREVFHQVLMLGPREQMVVPLKPLKWGGLVSARLLTPDAIEADNQRWVYAPSDQAGHALVLSPDGAAREDLARILLAVNPHLEIETAAPGNFDIDKVPHPLELAVMHDCYVPGIAAASTLLIYPPTAIPPRARIPGLSISWNPVPVFMTGGRGQVFGTGQGTMLSAVRSLTLPEWMETVAMGVTPSGSDVLPLAAIGRIPGGRIGVVAFDVRGGLLIDADRLDALVLMVDMIKRLSAPGDAQIVATGSYVDIPVIGNAMVTAPDGTTTRVEPDKWGRVRIRPMQSGHYSVESGNRIVEIFANYFDAAESDLVSAPAPAPSAAPSAVIESAPGGGPRQMQPLLILLAGLALLAFTIESAILIRHAALWGSSHV
ncbi:MAG TPA: VWA domain-containing protein [Candidatus Binataceae bacterium]|nr:VWA domain-containing protein [Candidatus Binataceae bacterium]